MDDNFVRNRITSLRLQKGVSEYAMSYALGHNKSYINNISVGRSMPSIKELIAICEYLEIRLSDFFDEEQTSPTYIRKIIEGAKALDEEDQLFILNSIQRLKKR